MNVSKKLMLSLAAAVITVFAMSNTISAASEKTGVVTGTVVNFRKEPSLSSKVLLKLKRAQKSQSSTAKKTGIMSVTMMLMAGCTRIGCW